MANKTLSGAEVIIECLKREGVDTIFGYPGGSAIPMFDAILDSSIKVFPWEQALRHRVQRTCHRQRQSGT